MEDLNHEENKGGEPPHTDPNSHESAVRTMKSDVRELLKTTKPSLVQLIEQEAKRQQTADAPDGSIASRTHLRKSLLIGMGVVAATLVAGFGVWVATRSPNAPPAAPAPATAPTPLFGAETSRTIEGSLQDRVSLIALIRDAVTEPQQAHAIERILIKITDPAGDRYASLDDLLALYRIIPPQFFLQELEPGIMPFSYQGADGPRFGVAARVKDPNRSLALLLGWEATLRRDFDPLLFDAAANATNTVSLQFEDRTYHNIDWRFLKISSVPDVGIGYTIFPARRILIMATSRASMEAIIDRLFNGR